MRHTFVFTAALLATVYSSGTAWAATPCQDLAAAALPDTAVDTAELIAAGTYAPAGSAPVGELPAFCRVHGAVTPVPGSHIGFELWLPQDGWNAKLLMVGNGGYSSAMDYRAMAAQLKAAYATLATDTGHTGDDLDFAAGRPEAIVDWGYRAVHEAAVKAKLLMAAFYGTAARHAYFSGCSTGGHQAFMEAQRYPEDFDGIVAGDPGHNRTHLNAAFLWQYLRNHAPRDDRTQIVPADKLPMVTRAVLNACRANNGTRSGGLPTDEFLNDPLDCGFDPASLQCRAGDGADCLTEPQVEAVRSMYDGAHNPRTRERTAFGFPRGSENSGRVLPSLPGWSLYWADPKNPARPARSSFWRVWAFGDPNWNWWSFDFDSGMAALDDKLAPIINAMNPDLQRFRRQGGKMIHYHGLADPVVPPLDSISYHERVVALQAVSTSDPEQARRETAGFYRLFLVLGMEHCQGGAGPDSFDAVSALDRWVETGTAPDRITAAHLTGDGAGRRPAFTRPLCPYPQQAHYRGSGDPANAGSFDCIPDERHRSVPALGPGYLR